MFDESGMENNIFVVIAPLVVGDSVILDGGYVVMLLGRFFVDGAEWYVLLGKVDFLFWVFDESGMENITFVVIAPLLVGDSVILDGEYVVLLLGRWVV